ncbi:MAG: hypothetical protein HYY06_09710 [Deltaproteobacteria bacterium]|nr:hypothetical protein [Deltaproteobacteria bacterium]
MNPEVGPRTHPYVATGLQESKLGVSAQLAEALYLRAARSRWLEVVGIDCHIAWQLVEVEPFVQAVRRVAILARALRDRGIGISQFDLGGGLGVAYREGTPAPPHPSEEKEEQRRTRPRPASGELGKLERHGGPVIGPSDENVACT